MKKKTLSPPVELQLTYEKSLFDFVIHYTTAAHIFCKVNLLVKKILDEKKASVKLQFTYEKNPLDEI